MRLTAADPQGRLTQANKFRRQADERTHPWVETTLDGSRPCSALSLLQAESNALFFRRWRLVLTRLWTEAALDGSRPCVCAMCCRCCDPCGLLCCGLYKTHGPARRSIRARKAILQHAKSYASCSAVVPMGPMCPQGEP